MNLDKLALDYKNGNKKAFDIIYSKTISYVRLVIYSVVQDSEITNDLIQDTYMKITNSIGSYNQNNFANWVYTIAKNTALDYVKKQKEEIIEDVSIIGQKPKNPYLQYAIDHLDEDERQVFLLKVLVGYTTKKIAITLDTSKDKVNNLYYSAKAKLKKMLEGVENEI